MIEVADIIGQAIEHCADNALEASLAQTGVARLEVWRRLAEGASVAVCVVTLSASIIYAALRFVRTSND